MIGAQWHARLRVGAHELAVPAAMVVAALPAGVRLVEIPRRGGPVVGACDAPWGLTPLVDLARWLDLGAPATGGGEILVLQDRGRRVAVRADALRGVARAVAHERLVHDEDPHQLFEAAVCWADGAPPSAVLDVHRLSELALAWAEPAHASPDGVIAGPATATGARTTPHAVLTAAGALWAIPATQLVKVIAALPLESALPHGGATRGFCTWESVKLPVVDLGVLHARAAAAGAWMAIVAHGDRAAALPVEAARVIVPLAAAGGGQEAPPVLVPGVGQVHPIDIASLLLRLPEAALAGPVSRAAAPTATSSEPASPDPRAGVGYILFEQDATYAAPAEHVLQVLHLDEVQARAIGAGNPVHVEWRGRIVPLHAMPCFGGSPSTGLPRVALLVRLPDGHGLIALAVARLRSWVATGRAEAVRVPNVGDLLMLTIGEGPERKSHTVVDVAEVACAFA